MKARRAMSQAGAHILLPTGFGHGRWHALHLALQIAADLRGRVTLFHVMPESDGSDRRQGLDALRDLYTAARMLPDMTDSEGCRFPWGPESVLNHFVRTIHPEWREHVDLRAECRQGNVVSEIVRFADECDVDTIILNTRPRTGLKKLMRSIGHDVLRKASCRVVLVHQAGNRRQAAPALGPLSRLLPDRLFRTPYRRLSEDVL